MATSFENSQATVISEDDARGAETGINELYVLGYGLAGVIIAFAAVALYPSFDRIHDKISNALSAGPIAFLRDFSPDAAILIMAGVVAALVLSAWNSIAGRSDDGSQNFMRVRVAGQFAAIGALMAMTYV